MHRRSPMAFHLGLDWLGSLSPRVCPFSATLDTACCRPREPRRKYDGARTTVISGTTEPTSGRPFPFVESKAVSPTRKKIVYRQTCNTGTRSGLRHCQKSQVLRMAKSPPRLSTPHDSRLKSGHRTAGCSFCLLEKQRLRWFGGSGPQSHSCRPPSR